MNYDHDLGIIDTLRTLDTTNAAPNSESSNSLEILGTGSLQIPMGTTLQQPLVGVGKIRYNTDTNKLMWSNSSTWADLSTGGTVTNVGLLDNSTVSIFTISNSPIVESGSLTLTLNSQATNVIFAAPIGSSGQPSFRLLDITDIPSLSSVYLPLSGGLINSGNNITMSGGGTITGLPNTPTNLTDATSKVYVDTSVEAASRVYLNASTNIGGHRVCICTPAGADYADNTIPDHTDKIIGLSNNSAIKDTEVTIVCKGLIGGLSGLVVGKSVYLSTNGEITQLVPSQGFILKLGNAISSSSILINIQLPIQQT